MERSLQLLMIVNESIPSLVSSQKQFFLKGFTKEPEFRIRQLTRLREVIVARESER